MTSWKTYKQTFRNEPDIFDFARSGDLRGFATIISDSPDINLNAKNHRGYSALMLAVYNSQQDFCEALLRCGADANSSDTMGNSLLMGAAFKGNLAILKLLLQYGANVTLENKSKMTVRDWALMFRRAEVVDYLDNHYIIENKTSQIQSFMRFIKLGLIMCQTAFKERFC